MIEQTPPQNENAERALLGSLACFPDGMDVALQIVNQGDFFNVKHQEIFQVFKELHAKNDPIDLVVVARRLEESGKLEEIGGPAFLASLMESMPNGVHVDYYAKIVREDSERRQFLFACGDAMRQGHDPSQPLEDVIGGLSSRLDSIHERTAGIGAVEITEALETLLGEIDSEDSPCVPTGFSQIDEKLSGGYRPGQLIIIAARPSVGKSALAICQSLKIATSGNSALFISLEMSRTELTARYCSILSGISCSEITAHCLDGEQKAELFKVANELGSLPLGLDDSQRRTIAQIGALGRIWKRRKGLDVLFVDYLTLLQADDSKSNRDQQVSAMSRGLKCIAKDLQVPIVCLAQLNRGVENRDNKRPRLSDLRDSGAIEQDADIVMFLHRPAVYDHNADPYEAFVIVSKNRNGPTGDVRLTWIPQTMNFTE